MVELLRQAVPATTLVVAIDCGKATNRVMLASGEQGVIGEPVPCRCCAEGMKG